VKGEKTEQMEGGEGAAKPLAVLPQGRVLELRLAKVLLLGIGMCAALITVSLAVMLARHGSERVSFTEFRPENSQTSIRDVIAGVLAMDGRSWLMLGVLCVLITPMARVAFSLAAFAKERDRLYVLITLFVLAVLMYSFFFGKV
jgi:uncharacterized membrane protein